MDKIKVAFVDDHTLFRQGLRVLLESMPRVEIVIEAGDGRELLKHVGNPHVPDVVLMDLRMPHMSGTETTAALKEIYPDVKVIALTMHDEHHFILDLFKKGVSGYLLKDACKEELQSAIYSVYENEYHFNDHISRAMLIGLFGQNGTKWRKEADAQLKNRELEVLQLICNELTSEEIANELCLSIRTIEGYRNRLLEKTGAKNSAGLVMYAVRNKLVPVQMKQS